MLRFVPFSMFLQKVRRIRAGMKPPPPIAMKRSGARNQHKVGAMQCSCHHSQNCSLILGAVAAMAL